MKKGIHLIALLIIINAFALALVSRFNWFFSANQGYLANKISSEENIDYNIVSDKEIETRDTTYEEVEKLDYLVDYWQYFYYLNSYEAIGYMENIDPEYDVRGYQGLCEYIAATMFMWYHQLYKNSIFFTEEEKDKYFVFKQINSLVSIPVHKYYLYKMPAKSFIHHLWERNNKAINIKSGTTFNSLLNLFIKDNPNVETNWSAAFMHSSSPEDYLIKYNVPVILTHAYGGGHSVVIYGYNSKTKEYLVNYGWAYNGPVFIKKSDVWSFWSFGYWNAIYYSNSLKQQKGKEFNYQDKLYSVDELEMKGISPIPNKSF